MIKSKLKRFAYRLLGKYSHIRATEAIEKRWYGTIYGGFYMHPSTLDRDSIIYSFGVGEDISFDEAVIKSHRCRVYAFDPTPKAIAWIEKQKNLPPAFNFHPYGIASSDGFKPMYLPTNPNHVSASLIGHANVNERDSILAEMKTLSTITKALGHRRIDVLKMDIEGAEYDAMASILGSGIEIRQILVELHERFFDDGKEKTIDLLNRLAEEGFKIFGISDSFEEISLIKIPAKASSEQGR